tara:strand:+ start:643 stop:861 length:219 start_codon:yes stop_codon:yes gene_type:complete
MNDQPKYTVVPDSGTVTISELPFVPEGTTKTVVRKRDKKECEIHESTNIWKKTHMIEGKPYNVNISITPAWK